jgi:hypothetical protein
MKVTETQHLYTVGDLRKMLQPYEDETPVSIDTEDSGKRTFSFVVFS